MDIGRELRAWLPPDVLSACLQLGELAASREESLHLVGGSIRDLLMGLPFREADLVLVGDVAGFTRSAEAAGAA
ncbi:MAG: hypothetical protein O3B84_06220, partial [Chloroflexi bacterium]|nr:hypothetical protein [Chloroflexota bacterium]